MSNSSSIVFQGLKFVSWIIFIGLCIEAGTLILNFIFNLYNPEMVQSLYHKLDLSEVYARSKWAFFSMFSFILTISILKAYLFCLVVSLVTKINLEKPFNTSVAKQISQLSYYTLSIGLISYLARRTANSLEYQNYAIESLDQFWADSQAFILMAALIYVIAVIFSKGVEFQEEVEELV